jgi:hypothetical protein
LLMEFISSQPFIRLANANKNNAFQTFMYYSKFGRIHMISIAAVYKN